MQYIKVTFTVPEVFEDILIAELDAIGFDSFATEPDYLEGYVAKEHFNEDEIRAVVEKYKELFAVSYTYSELEEKNWNEEWEKNFEPVKVGDKCLVRASFHKPDPSFTHEIIINPKMSFGTGHHETTFLMIENQLNVNHMGKKVMDAGSGTGILAILAEKLGALSVKAFDVEEWAFNNMQENVELNGCKKISVAQGTVREVIDAGLFDIILANINKNVLLDEMHEYSSRLHNSGKLLLSGFYQHDCADIIEKAAENTLVLEKDSYRNNWACLVFSKR